MVSSAVATLIMSTHEKSKNSTATAKHEHVRLGYIQKLTPEEKDYLAASVIKVKNT